MEHNFEDTYKKERTENILPGQIVMDPNDQASIFAAIDIVKAIQEAFEI